MRRHTWSLGKSEPENLYRNTIYSHANQSKAVNEFRERRIRMGGCSKSPWCFGQKMLIVWPWFVSVTFPFSFKFVENHAAWRENMSRTVGRLPPRTFYPVISLSRTEFGNTDFSHRLPRLHDYIWFPHFPRSNWAQKPRRICHIWKFSESGSKLVICGGDDSNIRFMILYHNLADRAASESIFALYLLIAY